MEMHCPCPSNATQDYELLCQLYVFITDFPLMQTPLTQDFSAILASSNFCLLTVMQEAVFISWSFVGYHIYPSTNFFLILSKFIVS